MEQHPIGNGFCVPRVPREVAALIAALQMKGAVTDELVGLKEEEWDSLLRFCDSAHLTLPLSQVCSSEFPSWVLERLRRNAADNGRRFERLKSTYLEVAAAFAQASIEHVVLKGFTQAPEYIANPRLRQQSDIDLYCPKEMIPRARAALESIGYSPEQTLDYSRADHLPTMVRYGDWRWRGNAFDPDMPLSIELHFCLWNEAVAEFPVPEMDRFWGRRVKRRLEDISFPALSPIDQLGYFTLHIVRDLLRREWVIHRVHELARFLHMRAVDGSCWREWKEASSSSFRALQTIAFFHANAWFSCDLHPAIRNEIAMLPPIHREWLKRFAGSALEDMFHKNRDGVWLHASLVRPARKRLELIWKTIVPTQVPSIETPARVYRKRGLKESRVSNKYLRYGPYLLGRIIAHVHSTSVFVWHGMILYFCGRRAGTQL